MKSTAQETAVSVAFDREVVRPVEIVLDVNLIDAIEEIKPIYSRDAVYDGLLRIGLEHIEELATGYIE